MAVAVAIGAMATLACWPGVATYDTVEQFKQVLSGKYDDWHPPVMARSWALLHAVFGGGAAPMMVLQMGAYWLGAGLVATSLAGLGRARAAAAILIFCAFPVFLCWQMVVLKDSAMVAALLGAVGLIAWYRLSACQVLPTIGALAGLLIAYATLCRANAVFATIPLAVMLLPAMRVRSRIALGIAGILLAIVATPLVNHVILGTSDSGVATTEPMFDLAAIAVDVSDPSATGLTPQDAVALRRHRCVTPFYWDPLGQPPCDKAMARVGNKSTGWLYSRLAYAIVAHPIAYAVHRIRHLNSTGRWLVPAALPGAWPSSRTEANKIGLSDPGPLGGWLIARTYPLADTPLAWPVVWVVAMLAGLIVALRREASPTRNLALALLVSAIALEASFAVVSIASDLRYHLWPMMAAGIAIILLADRRPDRRATLIVAIPLLLVVAGGYAARACLPQPQLHG